MTGCNSNLPPSIGCLLSKIPNIVGAAMSLIGVVTLFMVLVGAFRYITAQGDEKQLEEAKKVFIYAAIGLGVVLFSFLIMNTIAYITGLSCLTKLPYIDNAGIHYCQ